MSKVVAALAILLVAVVAFGLLFSGGESTPPASAPRAAASAPRESAKEAALDARLAECEIAIAWSRSQLRHERACEAEVFGNFERGDWGAPALRAGRFR